jgi:peroxiredoxin
VELPRLNPLYEKYKDRGLEIIAVEGFRMEKLAKKFIEENKLAYRFVQDNEGDDAVVRSIYKVNGFPTTFIVDRSGRVIYSHLGFQAGDEEKLEKEILSLL